MSFAQGAAFGFRTRLAGGIGILRDDAGNDMYEAQMFAQGTGYYYGIGLAWDLAGDDQWRAVRYAQGNGVHEAVGVLRDEAGDDTYELATALARAWVLTSAWACSWIPPATTAIRPPFTRKATPRRMASGCFSTVRAPTSGA